MWPIQNGNQLQNASGGMTPIPHLEDVADLFKSLCELKENDTGADVWGKGMGRKVYETASGSIIVTIFVILGFHVKSVDDDMEMAMATTLLTLATPTVDLSGN